MESIIKDRLITYLLENNLISKQQHGFLAKHSIPVLNCWYVLMIEQSNSILDTLSM